MNVIRKPLTKCHNSDMILSGTYVVQQSHEIIFLNGFIWFPGSLGDVCALEVNFLFSVYTFLEIDNNVC